MIADKKKLLTDFGRKVKEIRLAKSMTQDELADKCGYSGNSKRAAILKIESGQNDIPLSKLSLIAKALETTENHLLGWDTMEAPLKPLTRAEILDAIAKLDGPTAAIAMELYNSLDIDDQGEIRGEMKVMLKAEKYQEKEGQESA